MSNQCLVYETMGSVSEMQVAKQTDGLMTLSGVFGVCNTRNNNNRVYETSNYASMVSEMQHRIKESGSIAGELEHPNTMNITLDNISHKITDINIDENGKVTGTIQLLNTPKGKIAQAIVEGGLPLYVSSRAVGEVDNKGNVKLSKIATYDLVGSPGFSQAKMHLNESQLFESVSDNCCIIKLPNMAVVENVVEEKKEKSKNYKNNMEETFESRLKNLERAEKELNYKIKQLDEMIESVRNSMETPLSKAELAEEVAESVKKSVYNKITNEYSDALQKWIIEEYSSELQRWIVEEYSDNIKNNVIKSIAPAIEKWITEEYSSELQKWITEEYSSELQKWIIEEYSPVLQSYIEEHVIPAMQKANKSDKADKLNAISETLALLEAMDERKPQYGSRMINESAADEPVYVQNMPENMRASWNMADNMVKESVHRRAKLYDFNTPGAIERFWENVKLDEVKPAKNVYEGLDNIVNEHERAIRAQLRSFRNRK